MVVGEGDQDVVRYGYACLYSTYISGHKALVVRGEDHPASPVVHGQAQAKARPLEPVLVVIDLQGPEDLPIRQKGLPVQQGCGKAPPPRAILVAFAKVALWVGREAEIVVGGRIRDENGLVDDEACPTLCQHEGAEQIEYAFFYNLACRRVPLWGGGEGVEPNNSLCGGATWVYGAYDGEGLELQDDGARPVGEEFVRGEQLVA